MIVLAKKNGDYGSVAVDGPTFYTSNQGLLAGTAILPPEASEESITPAFWPVTFVWRHSRDMLLTVRRNSANAHSSRNTNQTRWYW